jgi:large subunit ribosomal protein L9
MKVILLNHIEKVGKKGEIVSVKRGFARNYLVPRNLAMYATPQNMKNLSSLQAKAAEEEEKIIAEFKKLDDKIRALHLVFLRKVDENEHMFGSVSETDIVHELSQKGIDIHKSAVVLDKHIKTLGESAVQIRLHKDVVSELRVLVEKEHKEEVIEEAIAPVMEEDILESTPEEEIADIIDDDV